MDEIEIIRRAQSGDRQAFGGLVERYHGFVYRLCYQMAGSTADAEDLAQDAFVEAFLKLRQLREPQRFAGWLRTLALNVCRMWHRRRRLAMSELPEDAPAPAEGEETDAYARLAAGLPRLSPPLRMALVLHYLEGLSYQEMAAFLAVPVGTVMSRLHRARRALKEMVEKMSEEEEPMVPDDAIREEVDAEIALLVRMAGRQPPAPERLSAILGRSPERLAQLLREGDGDINNGLALLLPRLGAPALDAVLDAYGAGDETLHTNARAVLQLAVQVGCGRPPGTPGWGHMAVRQAYAVLDRVFVSPLAAGRRAELVLDLMAWCEHAPTASLMASALLCLPDEAFPLLMERFRRARRRNDLFGPPYVLFTLCRFGRRFVEALLPMAEGADACGRGLSAAGVEAVARSLDHHWLSDATPEGFADAVRTALKWPPLRSEELGADAVARLAGAAARLAGDADPELASAGLRALGYLKAREHLDALRAGLGSEDSRVRMAAISAIAETRDPQAGECLVEPAEHGTPAERAAALDGLARLRAPGAEAVLLRAASDADAQVRKAAIIALGEVGSDAARTFLQQALRSGDKELARVAARSAQRTAPPAAPWHPSPAQERLHALRGEPRPFTHISLDAAIRFAFPEIRAYEEAELNRRIAGVCYDVSATRRYLVDEGLMVRAAGVYHFTELGKLVWRVEQYIRNHYTG